MALTAFAQTAAESAAVLPSWLQTVTAVAGAIVTIMLAVLLVAAVPVLLVLLRRLRHGTEGLDKVLAEAAPLLRDASTLVTEMRGIATSVRADVETVHRVVLDAEARYRELTEATARRLTELGTLVDVIRDGVEDAVVSVTAVARGVRAGAEALVGEHEAAHESTDEREHEAAASPESDASADGDLIEVGATGNGDDRARSPERRARPRIRTQRGGA
jgi:methyl-accepting chemotaxis protein